MASAEDYAAWIVKNAAKKGTPEFDTVARAYREAKAAEAPQPQATQFDPSEGEGELQIGPFHTGISMPQALTRGLAAAGKAYSDLGLGIRQRLVAVADTVAPRPVTATDIVLNNGQPVSRGDELRAEVRQSRARDKALMDTTAGKVGNVAGNVALFAPTALIPGAGTITGGATIGAITGALQPSESTEETLLNTGLGGVFGAAVPAASAAIKAGKAAAEPFYQRGRDLIVGRALNRAAGADAPAVANRLAQAAEYVPGSVPTVGQAAENAGVAALQRSAAATTPEVTNALQEIANNQNAARVGLLEDMAGRDGAKAFATANRDATAEQLYGEAFKKGLPALSPEAQANVAAFYQRMPPEVLDYARKLAKISGQDMTDETSLQGLHWVKKAMDGLISMAKAKGDGTMAKAYTGLQNDFLAGLDNLSKDYGAARNVYASMSKPINQMDVSEELLKAVDPLTGTLRPAAYARALKDPQLAARATGFNGATLENTLEPAQLNALEGLLKDVQRSSFAANAGRGSGSDTVQKLAYSNILDESGVPTFLRKLAPAQVLGNVTGRVADAAYGSANRELSNRLAMVMLDPKAAAELMKRATPAQKNALLQLAQQAGSGAALSAPAIANAQK